MRMKMKDMETVEVEYEKYDPNCQEDSAFEDPSTGKKYTKMPCKTARTKL
jgi:hypothetical protein